MADVVALSLVAEGLAHEIIEAKEHAKVDPVTEVLERLSRVLDRELGDARLTKYV